MLPKICVCGEGVGDFGNSDRTGPLFYVVGKLLQLQEESCVYHEYIEVVTASSLATKREEFRRNKKRKAMLLSGSKFRAQAQMLAIVTKETGKDMAILHADLDYTRSELDASPGSSKKDKIAGMHNSIRQDMLSGFKFAEPDFPGVPLIPVPRTEAWLIHLADGTLSPESIEALPGNDHAKTKGAKTILAELGYSTADQKSDLVVKEYDPAKMRLESHTLFLRDFDEAMTASGRI